MSDHDTVRIGLVATSDRASQGVGLGGRHDPPDDVVVEGEHRDRRLADRKCWGRNDWRQ